MKDQYQEQNRKEKQLHEGPGGGILQLPFWNDFSWSQPEYYETIQAGLRRQPKTGRSTRPPIRPNADVNNDQQDELFARGPRGILVNVFDPAMGQWLPMIVPQFDGKPIFSDAEGWNQPQYYQTIQTADINGDQRQELLARSSTVILLWGYNAIQGTPTYGQWVPLLDGPAWSDANGWNQPSTIRPSSAPT
jgi:hypothetical protein